MKSLRNWSTALHKLGTRVHTDTELLHIWASKLMHEVMLQQMYIVRTARIHVFASCFNEMRRTLKLNSIFLNDHAKSIYTSYKYSNIHFCILINKMHFLLNLDNLSFATLNKSYDNCLRSCKVLLSEI